MLILRGPRSRLEPMRCAEDWKQFLAKPELHWKDGRSAKMLAERWDAGPTFRYVLDGDDPARAVVTRR